MEIRVLDGESDHETSDKHDDRFGKVVHADLTCIHDAKEREGYDGKQRCHRQWKRLNKQSFIFEVLNLLLDITMNLSIQ